MMYRFRLSLLFCILLPIICISQVKNDHLEPVQSIFSLYDHQYSYYPNVKDILFEGLEDNPEIRYLRMPSFTPENVLDIQECEGEFLMVYRICDKMIWANKDVSSIEIKEYKKRIAPESVLLIKDLFLKAVMQTRYYEEEDIGLDGTTYYFFAWDRGLKGGTTWSPHRLSKMGELVAIGNYLVELTKNTNTDIISFDDDFTNRIKKLMDDLK